MADSTQENNDSFPSELQERLTSFDDALTEMEAVFSKAQQKPLSEIHEKLNPLDKAKMDLLGGYALNSLFWMYMSVSGENPKEHAIKQELDRIRGYMARVKEIEEKAKAPKIDKNASKRFVRSALWQMAQTATDTGINKANSERTASTSTECTDESPAVGKQQQFNKRKSDTQEVIDSPSIEKKKRKKSKKKNE